MVHHIHERVFKTRSAFAEVSVAAWLVWVGDLLCVIGDLAWLVGDMSVETHPHHYLVGVILLVAFTLIAVSGVWLYKGLNRYIGKHDKHILIKRGALK